MAGCKRCVLKGGKGKEELRGKKRTREKNGDQKLAFYKSVRIFFMRRSHVLHQA